MTLGFLAVRAIRRTGSLLQKAKVLRNPTWHPGWEDAAKVRESREQRKPIIHIEQP